MTRGGPQVIPRPPKWTPGALAPWAHLPLAERVVTAASLRRALAGRRGEASSVEVMGSSRRSAVLAAFYEEAGALWVVLTRRAWTLRAHTGEVCFPGGGIDAGETAAEAAVREAEEEVALDRSTIEILGELDHLVTVTARSTIVPLVALLPGGRPQLTPNPGEVDEILHVPVAELLRDDVYREERWMFEVPPVWASPEALRAGVPVERSIAFFELEHDTLWGITAAMLRHLLSLALGLDVALDHL
ncbi:MAG: CoA pyrophosphatase [Acidimicrobiales bacterium]